jgi:hypothetical protein
MSKIFWWGFNSRKPQPDNRRYGSYGGASSTASPLNSGTRTATRHLPKFGDLGVYTFLLFFEAVNGGSDKFRSEFSKHAAEALLYRLANSYGATQCSCGDRRP